MNRTPHAPLFCILLGLGTGAAAHHGSAPFDTAQQVTFEGVITEFDYRNPHSFVYLRTTDSAGEPVDMTIEAVGSSLRAYGLTPESLTPGERVIAVVNPSHREPGEWGLGVEIVKEDGSIVPLSVRFARELEQRSTGNATSIAGLWVPRREDFFQFTFGRGSWPLTEKGRQAREAFDVSQSPQGRCEAIPPPTLMLYGSIDVVEVLADRVLIHSDWLDGERVIYTDGRSPADDESPQLNGYSVGEWEGDTFVINTTHFSNNNSGNASGIPSGPQRRMTERFTLVDDGASMRYEYFVEDPEYLAEPVTGESHWDFRPDLEPDPIECDLESAARYLTE